MELYYISIIGVILLIAFFTYIFKTDKYPSTSTVFIITTICTLLMIVPLVINENNNSKVLNDIDFCQDKQEWIEYCQEVRSDESCATKIILEQAKCES